MARLIIRLQDGLVSSVCSDIEELEVSVFDGDCYEVENSEYDIERKALLEESLGLKEFY